MLVLSHGNSDPERGFSINKDILKVHGYSAKEDTPRFIKDVLILKGVHLKMQLSKALFTSCRDARSSCVSFLEPQKLEQEKEKKRKINEKTEREKEKEKDKKSDVLKRLEGDLELLHAEIRVAENAVEEGNTDFGEIMAKKPLDMNKLRMCQAQIAMGGKRINKLQLEVVGWRKRSRRPKKN